MPAPQLKSEPTLVSATLKDTHFSLKKLLILRGTQREFSSKPLKHSIVKSILVLKR